VTIEAEQSPTKGRGNFDVILFLVFTFDKWELNRSLIFLPTFSPILFHKNILTDEFISLTDKTYLLAEKPFHSIDIRATFDI